jgi:transposase
MPDRRLPNDKRDRIVELFNTTKLSNKEIAHQVGASERTVYSYRKRYTTTGVAVNPRTGRAPNSGNYKLFPQHDEVCFPGV